MPEEMEEATPRGIWSGILSFGLVSIPVDLHSITHPRRHRMRMLGPEGERLQRRYYCPEHERVLQSDEIVRGYEEDDGSFIVVDDDEIAALEPKRSREVDLQRFVPADQLSPLYVKRSYLLLPGKDSQRAYRLLARIMEETERVGIGSFVMRGHTYVVAITSARGILRAQTLRQADEVRSPEDVGLPDPPDQIDRQRVRAFVEAIDSLSIEAFDPAITEDEDETTLLAAAREKQEEGDVVEVPEESDDEGSSVVDLMALLKERLLGPPSSAASSSTLHDQTRQELYERAQELGIAGRAKMTKEELIDAIAKSA